MYYYKIVQYSDEEKEVRVELSNIDGVVAAAKAEKAIWDSDTRAERSQREASHRIKAYQLSVIESRVAAVLRADGADLGAEQQASVDALKREIKALESLIKVDKFDEKKLEDKVKKCEAEKGKLKAKLNAFHRKRKVDDSGVFQKMEKVLHNTKFIAGRTTEGIFKVPIFGGTWKIQRKYLKNICQFSRPRIGLRVQSV